MPVKTISHEITSHDDIIDVRDVIARVEELEEAAEDDTENQTDLKKLMKLLNELKGYGGNEQWRSDWYPGLLIRDSYFKKYAKEFADDIDAVPEDATWPMNCIDWDQAARELQTDYSSVEFEGTTYWYR
jgi:hypothetical protein